MGFLPPLRLLLFANQLALVVEENNDLIMPGICCGSTDKVRFIFQGVFNILRNAELILPGSIEINRPQIEMREAQSDFQDLV